MKRLLPILALLAAPAQAGQLTVHFGPPSLGNGGANPVSIPPVNPIEYEFEYCTDKGFESNIAVTPGILFGSRYEIDKTYYASFGGGLVIDANGSGPGIYSSLGANWAMSQSIAFNGEFKQGLGFSFDSNRLLSPYAIRIGLTFAF